MATILVVENDPAIRTLLKVALNWQGYRVLLAQNGAEGLSIHSKNPSVDAIVCDTDTPATGGLAFIEKVDVLAPSARVIAFVGRGEENLRKATTFGVVRAALSKPCLIADFWMTLERVIREAAGLESLESLAVGVPILQVAPAVTRTKRDRPASAKSASLQRFLSVPALHLNLQRRDLTVPVSGVPPVVSPAPPVSVSPVSILNRR